MPQTAAFLTVMATNPVLLAALHDEILSDSLGRALSFQLLVLGCCVCLGCVIWLFLRTGRVPGSDEIALGEAGRMPTEALAAVFLLTPLATMIVIRIISIYNALFTAALMTAGGGVMLACLLALARKWKAGRLLDDCLLARVWPLVRRAGRLFLRALQTLLTGENYLSVRYPAGQAWLYRILWVCGAMAALVIFSYLILSNQLLGVGSSRWFGPGRYTAFAMFAILVVVLGAGYLSWRAYRDAQAFDALLAQIDVAAKGEEAPVCVPPNSGLYAASQAVAQIGSHLRESVDAQIKSERMKLDLITNVSHDLKTPLTSIIGYLDLLEKQEHLPPETMDYIRILRLKSERLATTVADLFTLAKATSGSETLCIEPLDLVMAVHQTLGDLTDAIRAAGVPVKASMPESAPVRADSAKLYRVLQNILDNALRYSLVGTRIYLEVLPGDIATRLTLANTASYEMTFSPDEVLQRFVRGDASRTTEGSGLGLSIAQTFMQNFGGDLVVEVCGDVFRVTLTFPNGADAPRTGREKRMEVFGVGPDEPPEESWPEEAAPEQSEQTPEASGEPGPAEQREQTPEASEGPETETPPAPDDTETAQPPAPAPEQSEQAPEATGELEPAEQPEQTPGTSGESETEKPLAPDGAETAQPPAPAPEQSEQTPEATEEPGPAEQPEQTPGTSGESETEKSPAPAPEQSEQAPEATGELEPAEQPEQTLEASEEQEPETPAAPDGTETAQPPAPAPEQSEQAPEATGEPGPEKPASGRPS